MLRNYKISLRPSANNLYFGVMLVQKQSLSLFKPGLNSSISGRHSSLLLKFFAVNCSCIWSACLIWRLFLSLRLSDIFRSVAFQTVNQALVLQESTLNFLFFLLVYHVSDVLGDWQLLRVKDLAEPVGRSWTACGKETHHLELRRFSVALSCRPSLNNSLSTLKLFNNYFLLYLIDLLLSELWLQIISLNDRWAANTRVHLMIIRKGLGYD